MQKKKKSKSTVDNSSIIKIRTAIVNLLEARSGRAYSIKQITKKIGLKKREDIKTATLLIHEMEEDGKLKQLSNGTYSSIRETAQHTGIVDHVNARFAYVRIGEGKSDVYVKTRDLGSALDGDTVALSVLLTRHGANPEGKVVEVIKRNRTRFVGKLELSKNFAFVVPDFRKIHQDFFIYPEHINKAKANDKVIVEIIDWASGEKNATAKVVDILGAAGENEAEIHSIMAEFGLPFDFPANVLKE
jgi:ribonuclease R